MSNRLYPPKLSEYTKIEGARFTAKDFCETLDGGQAFRWHRTDQFTDATPEYFGVFGNNFAKLKLGSDGQVWGAFRLDGKKISEHAKELAEYLDCGTDYESVRKRLRASRDPAMLRALEIHPSLRILRQNPAEAIICFICSSSKRIVQIKQCVQLLAENLGEELSEGVFALPGFDKIADAPIEVLRSCKLGFRADYLKKSAEKIRRDKFDPMSLRELPYEDAKSYLTSLSGIGDKVADCILLFGASRFEAFPVDTWIKQAMTEIYSTPADAKKIRAFAAEKFGDLSGFAQQLIFAAKRKNLI